MNHSDAGRVGCLTDRDVPMPFESEFSRMSDLVTLELNPEQRETLLRGLRYIRSSIMLTPEEPSPETRERRNRELGKVSALSNLLSGKPVTQETSV